MSPLGFHHNVDTCVGCKACIVACKDKNDLLLGEKYRRIYDYAGCTWDVTSDGVCTPSDAFVYSVSVACNHCALPACFASCPVGAIIKRDDGIVYIDETSCIGCEACIAACPYSAPYLSAATGIVHKCDFCMDLIDNGEDPVCVTACIMRALQYGEFDELKAEYGNVSTVMPLPDPDTTQPSIVFTPNRLNPDGSLPGQIINTAQELESVTVE